MPKKSMKEKIAARFKQIQTDRIYENRVTRYDERRGFINESQREGAEIGED